MKLSCLQENLNKGLAIVSHITSKNVNLPILNNVLLKAEKGTLNLSATNLEIGIVARVRGKIEEGGAFTVQAKLLADYINLLPNEKIDLVLKDRVLKAECRNSQTKINGISAEEFPLIPQVEKKNPYIVEIKDFKEALAQVVFATAQDESRPEISGVLFSFKKNELRVVATDSYRLAEKIIKLEKSANQDKEIIVPTRTLQELLRILGEEVGELEIYLAENQILFSYDEVDLVSRIIEGQYPDYQQIIPREFQTQIIANTKELVKVIKTASLFCQAGINDVNLEFSPSQKQLRVSTVNTQLGESTSKLDIGISGQENKIVFNYRYLLDGLLNIRSEEVILEMTDSGNPGVLKPKDKKDYLYIIMPIKQ